VYRHEHLPRLEAFVNPWHDKEHCSGRVASTKKLFQSDSNNLGLVCVVVPTMQEGDEVVTDLDALQENWKNIRADPGDNYNCILLCTDVPDKVDKVLKLCQDTES
jgi:hypothetical protein